MEDESHVSTEKFSDEPRQPSDAGLAVELRRDPATRGARSVSGRAVGDAPADPAEPGRQAEDRRGRSSGDLEPATWSGSGSSRAKVKENERANAAADGVRRSAAVEARRKLK